MAVQYRSSTSTNTASTPASSITLTLPANVAVNDNLIASVAVDGGSGATVTAPSGWTQLQINTQTTNTKHITYWRLADGTESSTYQWSFDTTRQAAGLMAAYSGGYIFLPAAFGSTSNTTAATTLTAPSEIASYTGVSMQIFCTRNTTAANVLTFAGGYGKKEDSCTTASTFISISLGSLNSTKGFPVGGVDGTSATCTQSSTWTCHGIFLDDLHYLQTAMVEDEYVGGSIATSSGTLGINSLKVNYPNTLLLYVISINKDVQTVASIAGGGFTWVLVGRANTQNGSVEVWRSFAPSPTSFTSTVTFSAAVLSAQSMLVGIRGADATGTNGSGAIGATASASGTTSAATVALTTTRGNSWVFGIHNDPSETGSDTAGTNQTQVRNQSDPTNVAKSGTSKQNSITPSSGTSVTMNWTQTLAAWNIFAVEILAADKSTVFNNYQFANGGPGISVTEKIR